MSMLCTLLTIYSATAEILEYNGATCVLQGQVPGCLILGRYQSPTGYMGDEAWV